MPDPVVLVKQKAPLSGKLGSYFFGAMEVLGGWNMGVDLKVLVLSVVCDDLLYAKMTFCES